MNYRTRISTERNLTVNRLVDLSRRYRTQSYRSASELTNHGCALLQTDEEMDAYMVAYGEMHYRKLLEALKNFPFDSLPSEFEIVDWGCGQGIATLTFLEELQKRNMKDRVKRITLVEPSGPAIDRAEANISTFFLDSGLPINKINLYLPSQTNDLNSFDNSKLEYTKAATIHLFSNILDIVRIDLQKTASLILSPGKCQKHFIICVGPINSNSARIDEFCNLLGATHYFTSTYERRFGQTATGRNFGCKTRGFVIETGNYITPTPVSYVKYAEDGNYDDYDVRAALHFLDEEEIIAVMIVGYQLIVSAKGLQLDESDDPSIDIIYKFCGFDGSDPANMIGDMFWNRAIDCSPYEAFRLVSEFQGEKKEALIEMLNQICEKDNTLMRRRCFEQLVYIAGL